MDGTVNVERAITHQIEYNMFFKKHIERVRMDVCNLEKTGMILGMPWLQVLNPKINWEIEEIKMTRCPSICGRNIAVKKDIE